MLSLRNLMVLAALAGCTNGENTEIEREYTPLDPSTVETFAFDMSGFSGNGVHYVFDNERATFRGYRIDVQRTNNRVCRRLVSEPKPIDPANLRSLLAMTSTSTVDEASCARLNDNGIIIHGDFLGIALDGESFSGHPYACNQFVHDEALLAALNATLDQLSPVVERVQFDGRDYVAVGTCD
jgi:hypothetical protein